MSGVKQIDQEIDRVRVERTRFSESKQQGDLILTSRRLVFRNELFVRNASFQETWSVNLEDIDYVEARKDQKFFGCSQVLDIGYNNQFEEQFTLVIWQGRDVFVIRNKIKLLETNSQGNKSEQNVKNMYPPLKGQPLS
ncbi:MAG: hypothetical protein ACTSUV_00980 [Candidatus Ranarchaeia archaeon]